MKTEKDITWLIDQFLYYNNKGAYHEAIRIVNQIIELEPEDAMAHYNKGTCLSELGQDKQAIECFNRAIELDPSHVGAMYKKGECWLSLDKVTNAIECFDEVINLNPEHVEAIYTKAECLSILGYKNEAKQYFARVKDLEQSKNNKLSSVQKEILETFKTKHGEAKIVKLLNTLTEYVEEQNGTGHSLTANNHPITTTISAEQLNTRLTKVFSDMISTNVTPEEAIEALESLMGATPDYHK